MDDTRPNDSAGNWRSSRASCSPGAMAIETEPTSGAGMRTALAALAGALAFGLGASLAVLSWAAIGVERPLADPIGDIVLPWLRTGIALAWLIGLPGTLTLGLLGHAILERLGLRHPLAYVTVGLVLAALGALGFVAAGGMDFGQGTGPADYGLWGSMGAFAGGCGGAAFWLVRRP